MRRFLLTVGVILIGASAAALAPDIEPDHLLAHIKFLSSDEMKGRGNGSPELERAADYIAEAFGRAGLRPAGDKDSWFQSFELDAGLIVGRENRLTLERDGKRVTLTPGTGYLPLAAPINNRPDSPSTSFDKLPVVFAGYGLAVPSAGYDDYANLDVNGKAVLIFTHEPQEHDPNSRFDGTRPVRQTTLQAKASLARQHGARALLVISDPTHKTDDAPYALFTADPEADSQPIPVLRVRREEMKPFLDAWGLDALAREIDKDLRPRSRPLPGATVSYVEYLATNRRPVRNVVGVLPGSDPQQSREALVIGAHYDHVGLGGRLSVAPELTGQIHNGADDNASGAAAIIEMAKLAASQRGRFPRTLVFVAFAGEERGLLGSIHYTTTPAVPMDDTIGMLNLDMVGRANGSVDVSGLELSPSMEADLRAAGAASGNQLRVRREGPGAGRSDDSSFIARRVPAINFFTGFHTDYHRPGDDWEKIDARGVSQVAELALEFAARLTARNDRPEFVAPRRR
ncbi:MAG: M28 family peptidase [Vicinamibacterales bacterium]